MLSLGEMRVILKKFFLGVSFFAISALSADLPADILRRVHSYLLLEDPIGAIKEAEWGLKEHPGDRGLEIGRIKALAALGDEKKVLPIFWEFVKKREKDPNLNELLEEISWGILQKAAKSSQYTIRLYALLGAYLTHDARAVKIMQEMLKESNAILRANAVRMSSTYLDGPLEEEMLRLIATEKVWFVRMELISAIGRMRIKEKAHLLEEILAKDSLIEEKGAAIQALVQMYESIDMDKILYMAASDRAGLRQLAANAALFFDIKEAKDIVLPLLYDTRPDVRISILNALGLMFHEDMAKDEVKALLQHSLSDLDPSVAITAAWILMLCDPILAEKYFEKWLCHEDQGIRLMAASALAKTGEAGADFALKVFERSKDPMVRINLAIGLIGNKKAVKKCLDEIYSFLRTEKNQIMLAAEKNPLFPVISESRVEVREDIPNFPEAMDQMTRLQLVSFLAIMQDPRAQPALKEFLMQKNWGITGYAALVLLKEGDEDALQLIRNLLDDPQPQVKFQAAIALAMFGKDETALKTLEDAYPKADHQQKIMILEAMGKIGKAESCLFLAKAMDEPFEILRVVAASSIIQCLYR